MNARDSAARCTAALHNMSVPPRSVIDLRPLHTAGESRSRTPRPRNGQRAARASGPSGVLFARVHLVGLLHDGCAHRPCGRDIARGIGSSAPIDLLDAVALLRAGCAAPEALDAARRACEALSTAALHDEFLDHIEALGPMDLPPLLLARPAKSRARAAACRLEPLAALRLLAGTAGGLFVRSRTPSAGLFLGGAPGSWVDSTDFDYYLPLGAPASASDDTGDPA